MATETLTTIPEAVKRLFGLQMAQHPTMRNAINTLVKALNQAGVLDLIENEISYTSGGRKRWALQAEELVTLHNAIILQGIFSEPKIVVRLFKQKENRAEHADWARSLLLERQSVATLGLINNELLLLLENLKPAFDLKRERLPNPFDGALPQMGLSDYGGNLFKTIALQAAALSNGDSMMAHYLNGELEKANEAATRLQTDNPLLNKYRALIIRTYREAKEFDDLLDTFR